MRARITHRLGFSVVIQLSTSVPDFVQFPFTFQERKPLGILSLFFFLPGTTWGKIGYWTSFWT